MQDKGKKASIIHAIWVQPSFKKPFVAYCTPATSNYLHEGVAAPKKSRKRTLKLVAFAQIAHLHSQV